MATRMSMRCVVGSVLMIAGLGTCAQAQVLYAGPGTVVQGQVNGPFVYNSYGYPYLAPGSYLSGPVLVPVSNPYLYAPPMVLPPPYGYAPNFYRPRIPLPQVPYGGYQPRPNPPDSARPTASPSPSPQVAGRKPPADQKPSSTALPQKSAPPRRDPPSAPRPPATPTTSGQVPQTSSMDSKAPTSPDPNKPTKNLARSAEPRDIEPLKVIFDTDMDGDNDDVAAAAILHALADSGKAEILAMGVVSRCPYSPACLDAINTYYGRGDLPIGVCKGTTLAARGSPYAKRVAERCSNDVGLASEVPDVVGVYRRALAGRTDGAVTMIAVGQMNNLVDLLASGPDPHSDLSGRDLVRRKVAMLFVMAPYFNERNEYQRAYNFVSSPQAARDLIAQWPTQIKFGEGNLGHRHFIGSRLRETPAGNPARLAFEAYFAGKKENKRHCADPATVLYAVCGTQYFDEAGPGACEVREDGCTRWNPARDQRHFYNTQKLPAGELEQVMEQLLIKPPKLQG